MSVLYRPVKLKKNDIYIIDAYDGDIRLRAEEMKQMSAAQVQSALFFFYNLGMELSTVMLNYLEEEEVNNLMQQQTFQKNGDGINQFIHSLTEMLDDLKISLN